MKRVFLIVLDSFGIGQMPDAEDFGDINVNTLGAVLTSDYLQIPNMRKLGLFNIEGTPLGFSDKEFTGVIARMQEQSAGKDTTIGHWEIAGIKSETKLPTYKDGFPSEILDEFSRLIGRGVLCNKPYSGTKVIEDYGNEHMTTGKLIVYTSADSVFQIAAHEDVVPVETLYEYCKIARKILVGEHGVGRVIARPFSGSDGNFVRTSRRHDFSIEPPKDTMLDIMKASGKDVIAVGKIFDIFAGKGITEHVFTSGNAEGIERTLDYLKKDFDGLCFVNLVDFDMLYGHRRDIDGYAKALSYFDSYLPKIMEGLREDDMLIITADHGCDPSYMATTDHTREYVPMLMYGKKLSPANIGTRSSFADIAQTILEFYGIKGYSLGKNML